MQSIDGENTLYPVLGSNRLDKWARLNRFGFDLVGYGSKTYRPKMVYYFYDSYLVIYGSSQYNMTCSPKKKSLTYFLTFFFFFHISFDKNKLTKKILKVKNYIRHKFLS